jgi:hypothetical protein
MSDLEFQNLSTVQSALQPKPARMPCAATIAPSTFLTFLAGTTAIATITPPVSGAHMLALVFTTTQSGQFLTTGNITGATTTASVDVPILMIFDPVSNKYRRMGA